MFTQQTNTQSPRTKKYVLGALLLSAGASFAYWGNSSTEKTATVELAAEPTSLNAEVRAEVEAELEELDARFAAEDFDQEAYIQDFLAGAEERAAGFEDSLTEMPSKSLNSEDFGKMHAEVLAEANKSMELIYNMSSGNIDASKARTAFAYVRGNVDVYKALGLDFNQLIRSLEHGSNKMLLMQQDIGAAGVDILDNAEAGLDYFEGFCELYAEIKEGAYDDDKSGKREAEKAAKTMIKEHFTMLTSVVKRNHAFI
jgi:hypothetical protein